MKTLVLSVLCIVAWALPAHAGKNEGGAMITHTNDVYEYSGSTACSAPESDPGTCEAANTMATRAEGQVVWLLAAFPEGSSPGVVVISFGIDYDDTTLDPGAAYKVCAEGGVLEIRDPDWPYSGRGDSIAFLEPVVNDTFFPFYVFKINGGTDGSYFGTTENPQFGYSSFVDDSYPPVEDVCTRFGLVRWNMAGANDCPNTPTPLQPTSWGRIKVSYR